MVEVLMVLVVVIAVLMVRMVEDMHCNDSNRAVESLASFLHPLLHIPSDLSKAQVTCNPLLKPSQHVSPFSSCYQVPHSLGTYSMLLILPMYAVSHNIFQT